MKQHISADQLRQLTPSQQERLRNIWEPEAHDVVLYDDEELCVIDCYVGKNKLILGKLNFYRDGLDEAEKNNCLPSLSIGQCIELLSSMANNKEVNIGRVYNPFNWQVYFDIWEEGNGARFIEGQKEELIDALWEAVKSIL